ncbi:hypothetical protein R1flu_000089 [Riccia fluitans]|uniref:Uncharacterized protein n=1 Tax=Riccia fluitans TaxID=41844 RepID=A0ABD1Y0C6_9MARC
MNSRPLPPSGERFANGGEVAARALPRIPLFASIGEAFASGGKTLARALLGIAGLRLHWRTLRQWRQRGN